MDYEKKYNEALKWMRELYPRFPGTFKEEIEHYFPELRESEDERIRKAIRLILIATEDEQRDFYATHKLTRKDCTDWLEKQKVNTDGDFARGYDCGYECCLNSHGAEWFEKQKEQKPMEKQDYSGLNDFERAIHRGFLCAGVENVPVTIIKETAQDCLAQMKPAEWGDYKDKIDIPYCSSEPKWSEEDEKNWNNIWDVLDGQFNISEEARKKACAWLKSLRPQKKEDLPKWLIDNDYDEKIDGKDFSLHSVGLAYRGYYIPYSDLLKLPKED